MTEGNCQEWKRQDLERKRWKESKWQTGNIGALTYVLVVKDKHVGSGEKLETNKDKEDFECITMYINRGLE